MTRRLMVLRPQDVAVALQLVLEPDLPIARVARKVRLSQGEVHNAEQRLRAARLVRRHHRYAERRALLEFILHGVPYVFPGELGALATGVPTGGCGPVLSELPKLVGRPGRRVRLVWPSEHGAGWGAGLAPLYPCAVELPEHNPHLYEWLTLVDALRAGGVHEREVAQIHIEAALGDQVPHSVWRYYVHPPQPDRSRFMNYEISENG